MVVLFVLLVVIAALGVAAATGHTADTRDPAFGMGRLATRHAHR